MIKYFFIILILCVINSSISFSNEVNILTQNVKNEKNIEKKNNNLEVTYVGGIGNRLFIFWGAYIYALKHNKEMLGQDDYLSKFLLLPTIKYKNNNKKYINKETIFYSPLTRKKVKKTFNGNKLPNTNEIERINGYLQDYENLKGYEQLIQEKTIFKNNISDKNRKIIQKMRSENSVVLHVRRGDYIVEEYYILAPSYYEKGVKYIKERVQNPHFYIFSNDIKWAKENLKIDGEHTFVDWNKHDYEDLQLMTYAKHVIIANSTFSWWGAFLSKNKDKIVIMPDRLATFDKDWIKQIFVPEWVMFNVENDVLN